MGLETIVVCVEVGDDRFCGVKAIVSWKGEGRSFFLKKVIMWEAIFTIRPYKFQKNGFANSRRIWFYWLSILNCS